LVEDVGGVVGVECYVGDFGDVVEELLYCGCDFDGLVVLVDVGDGCVEVGDCVVGGDLGVVIGLIVCY